MTRLRLPALAVGSLLLLGALAGTTGSASAAGDLPVIKCGPVKDTQGNGVEAEECGTTDGTAWGRRDYTDGLVIEGKDQDGAGVLSRWTCGSGKSYTGPYFPATAEKCVKQKI
ncbi:hypothetical protein ABZX93_33705 [Streptomyces sp. NPDC006632]|uniref:hypothetical protein n=1 Tax=unclassified Streptomyces TaxID=2593676 RepID=UPI002E21A497